MRGVSLNIGWAAGLLFLAGLVFPVTAGQVYFAGTGHWYEAVLVPAGITWNDARTNATLRGGYLCTVTNAAENTFVASLVDISYYSDVSINNDILGPWLGGLRHANESNWQWITGEPFTYFNWYGNQPDGYGGSEQRLQYYAAANVGTTWGDHPGDPIAGYSLPRGYIVEYDHPAITATPTNGLTVISWPAEATGWTLETSPVVGGGAVWTPVATNLYQTNAAGFFLPTTNRTGNAFFRLRL
ncbi:MAG TPA: lectin-like protein [Dongiaceae bacterium]|jgi:hypothetical protein|nr:lectin-like protein [Dongiaceae bacterium]